MALIGVVAVFDGCAAGPSFTRADTSELPPVWRTSGDPQVTTERAAEDAWWKSFGDPVLDRLVDIAVAQNLPLQAAGIRIAEARAQWEIALGRLYPQLQLVVGGFSANGLTRQVATATNLDRDILSYELRFDAAWELDVWGKYRRGIEAETASTRASVADYDGALVSLAAEVARTYVGIRSFEALIAQAQANVRIQEESLRIAEARFRNGATSELDPAQATALLESTRASIPPLEFELQSARNALSTLLGQPAGAAEQLIQAPAGIPEVSQPVPIGVPADLVRRRPDVRRAEELAAAQSALIGVAVAELYPALAVVGNVGLQAVNSGPTSHELFSSDAFNYAIGPRIVWPFLNYGRLTNAVRVQDARFQQLLVEYRQTVLRAVQEVENALAEYRNARAALVSQRSAVVAAERSVHLSLVQYAEGAVDYQRVLDSQRSLFTQQTSVVRASTSVASGLIALHKALGGGWSTLKDRPLVPTDAQKQMKDRTDWGDLLSRPRVPERVPHPEED